MELRQYFSMLGKWLWVIVLAAGVAAAMSYFATSQQPKLYQASTKLLIGQSLESANPNPQDIETSQQLAQTYIQIARTSPVLEGVINTLNLKTTPDALSERFTANLIPTTQIIELRVDDTEPARAQAIANELAHQLTLLGPATQQESQQRAFVERQVRELQNKIEEGEKAVQELQNSIQVTLSAREIAAQRQQISTLETQISDWRQTYGMLSNSLAPRSPNFLSIIEPAKLPTTPYAPNVKLNVALAALVGLILAVCAVLTIEYLDDTIKNPDDVTEVMGMPILAVLSDLGRRKDGKLVAADAPRAPSAEAYRVLRTNIQFNGIDQPLKSILVASANLDEGKSVTAANLAVVMAQAGLRTVLVDADLRKPSQHQLFNLVNDVGLTNSLLKNAELDGFLRNATIENLQILTTGPLPPNPAELLASERMRLLKTRLEERADVIVYDVPPILPVADAVILARGMDGVVFVVDVSRTRRKQVLHAKEALAKVNARILGVALNRVSPRQRGFNYHYDYYGTGGMGTKKGNASVVNEPSLFARAMEYLTRR